MRWLILLGVIVWGVGVVIDVEFWWAQGIGVVLGLAIACIFGR